MQINGQEAAPLDTLAGRMEAARLGRGLTKIAVANQLGVSRIAVYEWLNGTTTKPGIDNLLAFTKLTDISLDWLVERRGPDPQFLRLKKAK
jgi:transcriptional regulator with XRE-family HTH domain